MTSPASTVPAAPAGGPRVVLLDGRALQEPLPALRRSAQALRPDGFVSRSYAAPLGVVAAHARAVGVDVERVQDLGSPFAASMATPEERAAGLPSAPEAVTAWWSAKEALAKALGDARAYEPDQLTSPTYWTGAARGRWRYRPLGVETGWVGAVVWAAS